MRWWTFLIALLIVFVAQTTAVALWAPPSVDLLLVLALVVGLAAPALDARLAAWVTGFAADLGSAGPLGVRAVAFGLAVWWLTILRTRMNLDVWWVRWIAAFVVALPAQLFVFLHERWFQDLALSWGALLADVATAALSALLAALVLALPTMLHSGRRRRAPLARW